MCVDAGEKTKDDQNPTEYAQIGHTHTHIHICDTLKEGRERERERCEKQTNIHTYKNHTIHTSTHTHTHTHIQPIYLFGGVHEIACQVTECLIALHSLWQLQCLLKLRVPVPLHFLGHLSERLSRLLLAFAALVGRVVLTGVGVVHRWRFISTLGEWWRLRIQVRFRSTLELLDREGKKRGEGKAGRA
jgi:hypothetical protein